MRLASESIPSYMNGHQGKTSVEYPDFTWYNIFLDDDANVTAFIDWDGVATVLCNEVFGRYPSWLTRDWDPAMYAYRDDEEPSDDMADESPPAELSRYRHCYASAFEHRRVPHYDPREARLSHILEAIDIDTGSQLSRDWIVPRLLSHAFRGKIPFNYRGFKQEYSAGQGEGMVELIRNGFANMWYAEWEADADEHALLYRYSTSCWRSLLGFED